jgi:hypothetical protein
MASLDLAGDGVGGDEENKSSKKMIFFEDENKIYLQANQQQILGTENSAGAQSPMISPVSLRGGPHAFGNGSSYRYRPESLYSSPFMKQTIKISDRSKSNQPV